MISCLLCSWSPVAIAAHTIVNVPLYWRHSSRWVYLYCKSVWSWSACRTVDFPVVWSWWALKRRTDNSWQANRLTSRYLNRRRLPHLRKLSDTNKLLIVVNRVQAMDCDYLQFSIEFCIYFQPDWNESRIWRGRCSLDTEKGWTPLNYRIFVIAICVFRTQAGLCLQFDSLPVGFSY